MRIGIFFGGPSREREISFAGGRTVYDNLDKSLFTAIPIFIDSHGNFILLDWHYLYKGTIRDFYPPTPLLPESLHFFQVYVESLKDKATINESIQAIGKRIAPEDLASFIDFAFLALHGPYGEDGAIQGLLEWFKIPYTGAGILPSSIGIDKTVQKKILEQAGFNVPDYQTIHRDVWLNDPQRLCDELLKSFNLPVVVKSPHQGSSIGITVVNDPSQLLKAIHKAFFIHEVDLNEWRTMSEEEKRSFLVRFTDIREGLGFPVLMDQQIIYHPEELWQILDQSQEKSLQLEAPDGEATVIIEAFIAGIEFSCIVIADEKGKPLALPPTEIRKSANLFDYRSKYLPGMSRKVTPIDLPTPEIEAIRKQCEKLFTDIHSQVYARIDGFYSGTKQIILNDPNTTSGMLPSSFFFHQAAEIGLNPSQFITYIIETSLKARLHSGKRISHLKKMIADLDIKLRKAADQEQEKIRVGVIMGGFSSERHISIESGRNIYEKLSSSTKYHPIPIFLTGDEHEHLMYQLPINIMLKDNADDIREKVMTHTGPHEVLKKIGKEALDITNRYAFYDSPQLQQVRYDDLRELIDFAFIALHGRPGEDGAVQRHLETIGLPYNGSGVESSSTTIDKYATNKKLREHGILVAEHCMVEAETYINDPIKVVEMIEHEFVYPFIAKPSDDGCSSAVKKIKNRSELMAFAEMMFRDTLEFPKPQKEILKLKDNEEFPRKKYFLIEELISAKGADQFMEITGGMLTQKENGQITYEVFEPSEALASGEVLSLEEKFLAGEGQNITPARFSSDKNSYQKIAHQVKSVLEKTARILKVEGYCRIDAFVRIYPDKVETIIIEINSLPGMTPATAIFHQAALSGLKPYEFIDKIISYGLNK